MFSHAKPLPGMCLHAERPTLCKAIAAVVIITLLTLSVIGGVSAGTRTAAHYTGRVLYRSNKAPVAGVLVEAVEAEDDGKPTDEVLGSARADAEGRFSVALTETTDKPVTLVVSAVRTSADSSGDRRAEGYDIKTHQTRLGYLPNPSTVKANTIYVERRRPGHPTGE